MSDFDPLAILGALERHRVAYVLIGDLAGVLHGTDLMADTVEITPSLKPENTERLNRALDDLGIAPKRRTGLQELSAEQPSLALATPKGRLIIWAAPPGTGGHEDLRRGAQREPLGHGIRVPVASTPDLIRSLSSAGNNPTLEQRLRRLVDLERGLSHEM